MSALLEETAWTELTSSRPPVGHPGGFDHAWPAVATELNEAMVSPNAIHLATSGHGSVGNVHGEGFCYSPTQLPVLHFIGELEEDGDDGGEFAFAGIGTVRAYDAYRNVYLKGTATRTFSIEQTPFIEGFHGHAVVSDDAYTWSVNTTSLYRVTGVVPVRPPTRRARHQKPSRAYDAFRELGAWLEMSDEELSPIVQVARGTVSRSWKNGTEPRKRAQARRLFQLHGVVSALHSALGDGLTLWLKHGSPCPLKLLEMGNIDEFERAADAVIFPPSATPKPRLDAAWPPSAPATARGETTAARMKRSTRVRSRRLER
jgi:hypothetical protein